jgi:hypothetical protein
MSNTKKRPGSTAAPVEPKRAKFLELKEDTTPTYSKVEVCAWNGC